MKFDISQFCENKSGLYLILFKIKLLFFEEGKMKRNRKMRHYMLNNLQALSEVILDNSII